MLERFVVGQAVCESLFNMMPLRPIVFGVKLVAFILQHRKLKQLEELVVEVTDVLGDHVDADLQRDVDVAFEEIVEKYDE